MQMNEISIRATVPEGLARIRQGNDTFYYNETSRGGIAPHLLGVYTSIPQTLQ